MTNCDLENIFLLVYLSGPLFINSWAPGRHPVWPPPSPWACLQWLLMWNSPWGLIVDDPLQAILFSSISFYMWQSNHPSIYLSKCPICMCKTNLYLHGQFVFNMTSFYSHGQFVLTWPICIYMANLYLRGQFVFTWPVCIYMANLHWHGQFVFTWLICIDMANLYLRGQFILTWPVCIYMANLYLHGQFVFTWYICIYMVNLYLHGLIVNLSWSYI